MKSKYFKNLAKGLVVAGAAFALVNCGDAADQVNNAVADAQQQYQEQQQQQGGDVVTDPATNPSQTVTDPAQQGTVTPVDPADPNAISNDPNQGVTDPTQPEDSTQTAQPADTTAQVTEPVVGPGSEQQPVDTTATNPPAISSSSAAGSDPVPTSSSAVDSPKSSSSEAVKPASSSSEQVVSSSSAAPKGVFLASGKEEEKDQMQIVYTEDIEPCIWDNDKKRNLCKILAYPKQLSETQKHAVVVWGPGGGSDPKEYRSIISRLASHGFVVVALPVSPGDASQGKAALDWLEQKNSDPNDPLYQKLDMTKVGASGHSMGGLESEQLVIKDKRVLTAFLNNSGDWYGNGANKVPTDRSIAILYGEGGMERGNAENDYNNAGVKAPACLIQMTGGRGNECYEVSPGRKECGYGHGSGSWDGMAATVAWMRWHLGGETNRKADFVGSTGKYIDGSIIGKQGHWKTQCKNF